MGADPAQERTLTVWTKCRHLDNPTDAERVYDGCASEGPFASHAINLYDDVDEPVPVCHPSNTGVDGLKARLAQLLNNAVKRVQPQVRKQVREKLRPIERELRSIGDAAPDPNAIALTVMQELRH